MTRLGARARRRRWPCGTRGGRLSRGRCPDAAHRLGRLLRLPKRDHEVARRRRDRPARRAQDPTINRRSTSRRWSSWEPAHTMAFGEVPHAATGVIDGYEHDASTTASSVSTRSRILARTRHIAAFSALWASARDPRPASLAPRGPSSRGSRRRSATRDGAMGHSGDRATGRRHDHAESTPRPAAGSERL